MSWIDQAVALHRDGVLPMAAADVCELIDEIDQRPALRTAIERLAPDRQRHVLKWLALRLGPGDGERDPRPCG